jgi:hypothetical protein
MNKDEIAKKLKDGIVYTFTNPFDAGVTVALYIIGASAGICCVLASGGLALSMIKPFLEGIVL